MSQDIDFNALKEIVSDIERAVNDFPEFKREFHERMAKIMQEDVDDAISQNLDDSSGQVKNWQTPFVGSGGGYAAVRAKPKTFVRDTKDAVGYITNALENGYRIRPPSGKSKSKYRPRIKGTNRVPGFKFYAKAKENKGEKGIKLADEMLDEYMEERNL